MVKALKEDLCNPLLGVKSEELVKDVFHLAFPSRYLLTSTFLRFQEHYESPHFRGKIFTREEFEDWYCGNQRGGFNFAQNTQTLAQDTELETLTAGTVKTYTMQTTRDQVLVSGTSTMLIRRFVPG